GHVTGVQTCALPILPIVSAQAAQPGALALNPAVAVYQQNGGSVVNITSLAVVTGRLGQQPLQQPQGIGSGFFIDTDGRIVTNNQIGRASGRESGEES